MKTILKLFLNNFLHPTFQHLPNDLYILSSYNRESLFEYFCNVILSLPVLFFIL